MGIFKNKVCLMGMTGERAGKDLEGNGAGTTKSIALAHKLQG
jgi:hypothetical protein